jgi:uncharacterized short protein YbdD (DUF466 family)
MNGQAYRIIGETNLLARRLHAAARVVRSVLGVPDYERYLAHMRATHPNATLLTSDEFARERLNDRYSKPGARCC